MNLNNPFSPDLQTPGMYKATELLSGKKKAEEYARAKAKYADRRTPRTNEDVSGREIDLELSDEEQAKIAELKERHDLHHKMAYAREKLGEDYLGPEAIEKAFGIKVPFLEVHDMPYSLEDLEKARELGEMLILRIAKDKEGQPMTMKHINQLVKMDPEKDGKLLSNQDWYKKEDFFNNQPLKTEWRLVGKEFVPDSTNQNYIHQTRLLRNYLKGTNSLSEEEEASCSDRILKELNDALGLDWTTQNIVDRKQYNMNWEIVARKLSEMAINMNHRRSPAEILYDQVLIFKTGQGRGNLDNVNDWSSAVSSGGHLVRVGRFDAAGADVFRWNPDRRDGFLGVVPVR